MASTQAHRREQLSIPIDPALRVKVETAAKREGRTVANFVRLVVSRAVEQQSAAPAREHQIPV